MGSRRRRARDVFANALASSRKVINMRLRELGEAISSALMATFKSRPVISFVPETSAAATHEETVTSSSPMRQKSTRGNNSWAGNALESATVAKPHWDNKSAGGGGELLRDVGCP